MLLITLIIALVPLALLAGIALPRAAGPGQFAAAALALGLGLLFMWVVFPWDLVSIRYRQALPWLYVLAVYVGYRRIRPPTGSAPPRWQAVLSYGLSGVLILTFAWLTAYPLRGYPAPDGAVELASPLRDGRFVVGHGGASRSINAHARVPIQKYALDIVGYNLLGMRHSFSAADHGLEAYAIFGHPLYAPCDGRVLVTVDGLEDLPIGSTDRDNLAGNHVVIECKGVEVVLAHLRKGSVRVSAGQEVSTETVLGEVGNSGNTSEPHLHLHAERGGPRGIILDGEPVPMLIDGRFLVRGDTL